MTEVIYEYLRRRFYQNNHAKYRKYFKEWVINLTESQIYYFKIEMENILNNAKIINS
jgi:hypothetical protein